MAKRRIQDWKDDMQFNPNLLEMGSGLPKNLHSSLSTRLILVHQDQKKPKKTSIAMTVTDHKASPFQMIQQSFLNTPGPNHKLPPGSQVHLGVHSRPLEQ